MQTGVKKKQRMFSVPTFIALICVLAATAAAGKNPPPGKTHKKNTPEKEVSKPTDLTLLDQNSFWRCRYTFGTETVITEDRKSISVHPDNPRERMTKVIDGKKKYWTQIRKHPVSRVSGPPPGTWAGPDFDDNSWARMRGPFSIGRYRTPQYPYRSIPAMYLRGTFSVTDPARAQGLKLSVSFHGGIAVYLNGRELTRKHLPEGELKPGTPSEPYPDKAFFDSEGFLLHNGKYSKKKDIAKVTEAERVRLRSIEQIRIPVSMLRKGLNIVAIEVHRAPAHEGMFMRRARAMRWNLVKHTRGAWWNRIGVKSIRLFGPLSVPAAGNACRPEGFQVWPRSILSRTLADEYGDAYGPKRPVRICGARNGVFSGQIVVSSSNPIAGLNVAVSGLHGPHNSSIPSSAVQVRYAVQDMPGWRSSPPTFDALEEFSPEKIPVITKTRINRTYCAMQPVWLTVHVPRNIEAGNYRGTATIAAEGETPVSLPLCVHVADWTLPDPSEFETHTDFMQSPETLAMKYKVDMWSGKHFELISRSLKLLGGLGNKTLYITLIRRTLLGNKHAMVRWIRKPDGEYDVNLSIAKKYLDTAVRTMGKIPVVCLYCWESKGAQGQLEYQKEPRRDREILYTLEDPEIGSITEAIGPDWDTSECAAFWHPALTGIQDHLNRLDMGGSLMLGLCGDRQPTEEALSTLEKAVPGAKWVIHAHNRKETLKGNRPVGYSAAIWGVGAKTFDPDFNRGYGWRDPFRTAYIPRGALSPGAAIVSQHIFIETWLAARGKRSVAKGVKGIGHLGWDFWSVDLPGRGRRLRPLANRYPEAAWGALSMNWCGNFIIAPGRDGPIATVRYETLRENIQECQARIFIEKVLLDEKRKKTIGPELAGRAQDILDQRVRIGLKGNIYRTALASNLAELTESLYEIAAEISKKLI